MTVGESQGYTVPPKQHHHHEAYDRKAPSPVDGFDTFGQLGLRTMHM